MPCFGTMVLYGADVHWTRLELKGVVIRTKTKRMFNIFHNNLEFSTDLLFSACE